MKLPISLFLAIKYLKPKRSMVSVVTVLTMMGIMLGVAVLIVVLSVMTGFDDVHKEHMIKLDSHIQISTRGQSAFRPDQVLEVLNEMPQIKAAAPAVEGFVMMTRYGQAITAVLRGIDPELEKDISDIEAYLIDGELPLEDETVVVGSRLAMPFWLCTVVISIRSAPCGANLDAKQYGAYAISPVAVSTTTSRG